MKAKVNKRFWLGMLAMSLVFGISVVGCDNGGGDTNYFDTLDLKNSNPTSEALAAGGVSLAEYNQIKNAGSGFRGWTIETFVSGHSIEGGEEIIGENNGLIMVWTGGSTTAFNFLADELLTLFGEYGRENKSGIYEASGDGYNLRYYSKRVSEDGFYLPAGVMVAFLCTAYSNGSTDLPVKTIKWELLDDGYRQLYTNDSYYFNYYIWNIEDKNKALDTFEIECKKISGSKDGGYGIIFGAEDSYNFYYVLITSDGWYTVEKMINKEWEPEIKPWDKSNYLITGYGKTNTIKVTRSGTTYNISLNGNFVYSFSDSTLTGNKIGYIANISSKENEKFPNVPVDVRIKLK